MSGESGVVSESVDYEQVVPEIIEQLKADERFSASCERLQKDGLLNKEKIFDDAKITDHSAGSVNGQKPLGAGHEGRGIETRGQVALARPP